MQEKDLYLALLSPLTDAELVEVIGSVIMTRNKIGLVLVADRDSAVTTSASILPESMGDGMTLAGQLRLLAAWADEGEETMSRVVGRGDGADPA